MKRFFVLIASFLFVAEFQAQGICYSSTQTPLIPPSCADYNQYVPTPQTIDLHYRINMHFFKPSSGTGIYDNVTLSQCSTLVSTMNGMMANLQLPTQPVSPAASYISNSHIQFDLMNIYFHTDNTVYSSGGLCGGPTGIHNLYAVNPESEVNIYFYNDPQIDGGCGPTGYVTMSGPTGISNQWVTAQLLIHELGHAVGGLHHTISPGGDSFTDTYPDSPAYWGWFDCYTTPASNNVMGYNTCRNYLSPMQLGYYHMLANTGVTTKFTTLSSYNVSNSITVSSTQTWSTSKSFSGNITIASGATLTVQCDVFMAPTAKIIVERGAKLIVDGGRITSATSQLWYGVDAWGNSALSQFTSGNTSQSTVEVKNGGVLEYMQYGIITDRPGHTGYHGAIIKLTNAVLRNNVRCVQLLSYSNFVPSSGSPASNQSVFQNTRFEITSLWRTSYGYPSAMISMDNVNGINIQGCEFLNSTSLAQLSALNRGTGVSSLDASYTIGALSTIRSKFDNLTYGVNCSATNPLKTVTVCYTDFYNNLRGMLCTGLSYATVFLNSFNGNGSSSGYCIYLDGCSAYQVEQNDFSSLVSSNGYGLYVRNSNNVGNINGYGNSNIIYNNAFNNFQYACVAFDDNDGPATYDGLRFNCNDYTGNVNDIYVGNSGSSSVYTDIGLYQGTATSASTYVRNRHFTNNCVTGQENQFGASKSSPQAIYHHTNNTTQMIPQCKDGLVLVTTYPIVFNKSVHCPTNFGGGGSGRYSQITTLHTYQSEITQLNSRVRTTIDDLITIIEDPTLSDSVVLDSVLQYSPNYLAIILPALNSRLGSVDSNITLRTTVGSGSLQGRERENAMDSLIQLNFEFEILLNAVVADILRDSSSNSDAEIIMLLDTFGIANSPLHQWLSLSTGNQIDSSGYYAELNEINEIIYDLSLTDSIFMVLLSDTGLYSQLVAIANDTISNYGSSLRAAESAQAMLRYYLGVAGYGETIGVISNELNTQSSERLTFADQKSDMVLYPNPSSGVVHFMLPNDSAFAGTEVRLVDVSGRIVANLVPTINGSEATISVDGLASGLYCCMIISNEVILKTASLVIKNE